VLALIECKKKNANMKVVDSLMVEEATNEEVELLEMVKDVDRPFAITADRKVILQDTFRTLQ